MYGDTLTWGGGVGDRSACPLGDIGVPLSTDGPGTVRVTLDSKVEARHT